MTINDETPDVPDEAEGQMTGEAEEEVEKGLTAKPGSERID